MQLNDRILAAERRAGLAKQPMVMWINTVSVNDDGTKDLAREAVVVWANRTWALWEAGADESEHEFKARILSIARDGAPEASLAELLELEEDSDAADQAH